MKKLIILALAIFCSCSYKPKKALVVDKIHYDEDIHTSKRWELWVYVHNDVYITRVYIPDSLLNTYKIGDTITVWSNGNSKKISKP